MCASAVFKQPAVSFWLLRTYRACRALASLLPLPLSPLLPEPSEAGACGTVVTFVHLTLGYALPLMVAATVELRARQQHAMQVRMFL